MHNLVPITVDTKLIPLLGKPLRQSFAPRMQNSAYKAMGFDGVYFPLEIENDHLEAVVNALRWMNVPGFAVTKPNKVEVLKYLDELDELAQKMGACNTVVNKNGVLKGYNTDGVGGVKDLIQHGVDIEASTFFSLGAGGAGRAMCFTLAHYGAKKLYIVDCTDAGEALAKEVNENFGPIATACHADDKETMLQMVKDANVLMNLSGVGMYPKVEETWIDKAHLAHKPVCFDATYNPLKTQFLIDAEEVGCQIINGLGMSINQGAVQAGLWTGQPEPYEAMTKEIKAIIAEQK